MPPTSNKRKADGVLGFGGLPDRDNPLAWKQKTREGKLGARELLNDLSDDEIARYMAISTDQVVLEEKHTALKIMCAVSGVGLLGVFLRHAVQTRFSGLDIAGLGLGLVMVYWPWRVFKCRQLWLKHFEAAHAEQARRHALVDGLKT